MFEESRIVRKNQPSKPSLITTTGESYQPARLYYQVGQKNAVLGRFKRLRCIDYDQSQNRWVWYYTEEAKSLKFITSYRDIPKEQRPVVLGYFTWKGDREELDLNILHNIGDLSQSIYFNFCQHVLVDRLSRKHGGIGN